MDFHAGQELPPYQVRAFNASTLSDNKIHDDTVARGYGFAGGLVPGVTVYAYMTHPVAGAFGRPWLERGRMSARFLRPFYNGELATVRATVVRASGAGTELALEAVNERGEACATGSAVLEPAAPAPFDAGDFPEAPLPSPRHAPTPGALAPVRVLGSLRETWDAAGPAAAYLDDIAAGDEPHWRGPDALAHPAYLLRKANLILSGNVALGPWIHVSSDVQHFGVILDGDELSTRGRVAALFSRKGHEFVELDVAILAAGHRPVLRAKHTAIYAPRRAAPTSE